MLRSTVCFPSALDKVLARILTDSVQQIGPSRLGFLNHYEEIIGRDELFMLMGGSPTHPPLILMDRGKRKQNAVNEMSDNHPTQ